MDHIPEYSKLAEFMPALQHNSPSVRRSTIRKITKLMGQESMCNTTLVQMFDTELFVTITNMISDNSESVREQALQCLLQIMSRIAADISMNYMGIFLAVIWSQLGCAESMIKMMQFRKDKDSFDDFKTVDSDAKATHQTKESSEEIRILIVQLLSKIISANYTKFIAFLQNNNNDQKYCFQYLNILHLLFTDKCPQIRKQICQILLNQIGAYHKCIKQNIKETKLFFKCIFDDYAEYLCLSLAQGCRHQRGKIRLISFQLLSKIIENNIKIKKDFCVWITDDQKIWKYISYLSFEQTQHIKQTMALSAHSWLSLVTETKTNINDIQCSKIWLLLLNQNGLNALRQNSEFFNAESELLKYLPFIVTLCGQEINHWQSTHRLFGIKALFSLLLCLESKFPSKYVINLLPNLVSLIDSQNEEIVSETNKCLKLFGKFIPISEYSHFLFSKWTDEACIKSYLKLSAQILTGFDTQNLTDQQLFKICKALSESAQQSQANDIGSELLKVANNLLCVCNACEYELKAESVSEILWLILQTHATFLQTHNILLSTLAIENSDGLSAQISKIIQSLMSDQIWAVHFEPLFERINSISKQTKSYYSFAALVYYSKECISKHMNVILPIFEQCNNENNEETMRYCILSILHFLLKHTINSNDWQLYSEPLIISIFLPNIVWKVGKFSLKMRRLSLDCMLILYANKSVNPLITWQYRQKLISTLKSRLDDFEFGIRLCALRLFDCVLISLSAEACEQKMSEAMIISDMKSLCQHLLDRFEDSKDEIRICTCNAVQSFIKCMDRNNIDLYIRIIQTCFIHFDDANHTLQQRVFALLKEVSAFNESVFQKQLRTIDSDNIQQKSKLLMRQLMKEI